MLKLETDIKFHTLPDHLKEYLSFFPQFIIKQLVAGFTFVMLDLLILVPLIYPLVESVLYLTVPLIVIINLWALRLLIKNSAKTEFESILFLGSLGCVGSFCVFILIQKMSYFILKLNSPIYLIISLLAYIVIIVSFIYLQDKKFSTLKIIDKNSDENNVLVNKLLSWSVPAGYIVAQFFINQPSTIMHTFMILVFSTFLLYFTDMSVKFFHRYLFMKTNIHLVKLSKPKTLKLKTQKSKI